jgi:hypothetical protein
LVLTAALAMPSAAEAHFLSFGRAKTSAQKRANLWAGQRAQVHVVRRTSRHAFFARARWRDVGVPPGDGAGQRCSISMRVGFASPTSRRVIVRTDGPRCR